MRRWPISRRSPAPRAIRSTGWSTRSTSWWAAIPRPPSTRRVRSCDFSSGEIDFTDLDNFADGFPHPLFEVHRREAPVYWHAPTENTPDGEGFWSVATYAETLAVFRDPVTYSSVSGGSRPYWRHPVAGPVHRGSGAQHDGRPAALEIRRLVSSGLTPRMITRVEDDLRARARRLLDSMSRASRSISWSSGRRAADADDLHPAGSS